MVEVDTATRCCLLSELYQVDRGKVFLSVDELVKCVMAIENVDTIRIDELTTLVTLPDEAAIAQLANSDCDDGMSWIRLNKRDLGWLAIAALEEIFRSQPPNAYQNWCETCADTVGFEQGTFWASTKGGKGVEIVQALLTENFALHDRLKDDSSEHVLSLSASGLAVYKSTNLDEVKWFAIKLEHRLGGKLLGTEVDQATRLKIKQELLQHLVLLSLDDLSCHKYAVEIVDLEAIASVLYKAGSDSAL